MKHSFFMFRYCFYYLKCLIVDSKNKNKNNKRSNKVMPVDIDDELNNENDIKENNNDEDDDLFNQKLEKMSLKKLVKMNQQSFKKVVENKQKLQNEENIKKQNRNKKMMLIGDKKNKTSEYIKNMKQIKEKFKNQTNYYHLNKDLTYQNLKIMYEIELKYCLLHDKELIKIKNQILKNNMKTLNWNGELDYFSDILAINYILIRTNRKRGGEILLYLYGTMVRSIIKCYHYIFSCLFIPKVIKNMICCSDDDDGDDGGGIVMKNTQKNKQKQLNLIKLKNEANRILVATKHPTALFAYEDTNSNSQIQMELKEKQEIQESSYFYNLKLLFQCCFYPMPILSSCESILKLGKNDVAFSEHSQEHSQNYSYLSLSNIIRKCIFNPLSFPIAPFSTCIDLLLRRLFFIIIFIHVYKLYFEMDTLLKDIKIIHFYNQQNNQQNNHENENGDDFLNSSSTLWLNYNSPFKINLTSLSFRFTLTLSLCLFILLFHSFFTMVVLPHRDFPDNYSASIFSVIEVFQMLLLWRRLQLSTGIWRVLLNINDEVASSSSLSEKLYYHGKVILFYIDKSIDKIFTSVLHINKIYIMNIIQFILIICSILYIFLNIYLKYNWQLKQEKIISINSVVKLSQIRINKKLNKTKLDLDERYKKAFGRERMDITSLNMINSQNINDDDDDDDIDDINYNYKKHHRSHNNNNNNNQLSDPKLWSLSPDEVEVEDTQVEVDIEGEDKERSSRDTFINYKKKDKYIKMSQEIQLQKQKQSKKHIKKLQNKKRKENEMNDIKNKLNEKVMNLLKDNQEQDISNNNSNNNNNNNSQQNNRQGQNNEQNHVLKPHYRHECEIYKFDVHPQSSKESKEHSLKCGLCLCYICLKRASSCNDWDHNHCHAHPGLKVWKDLHNEMNKNKLNKSKSMKM